MFKGEKFQVLWKKKQKIKFTAIKLSGCRESRLVVMHLNRNLMLLDTTKILQPTKNSKQTNSQKVSGTTRHIKPDTTNTSMPFSDAVEM